MRPRAPSTRPAREASLFRLTRGSYLRYDLFVHDIKIDGIAKSVRGFELHTETQNGWKVVGSYQDTMMEQVFDLEPTQNGSYSPPTFANGMQAPQGFTYVQKMKPSVVTFFVLVKDSESIIASLNDQLAKERLAAKKAAEDLAALQKLQKETEDKLSRQKAEAERLCRHVKDVEGVRDQERTVSRKLEVDIGKIRTAIGERQIKEILGS